MQLVNKETLLETERSAGAVIGRETVEQAPVLIAGVAIAITRLLREDRRVLHCVLISPGDDGRRELFRVENFGERFGLSRIGKEGRNSGRCIGFRGRRASRMIPV